MSRVQYTNATIQKAMQELDDLEQSMGWNMRCAYPEDCPEGEDFHALAMGSLAGVLSHLPTLRRLLDEVEAEVIKTWVDAAKGKEPIAEALSEMSPEDRDL